MTSNKVLGTAALALGSAMVATHPAHAQQEWDYTIKPYGWYVWFDGDTGAGGVPPIDSDNSLIDVLDGFFLIQGTAKRGKLSILGEFNWVDMSDTFNIGPVPAGWDLRGFMVAAGLGYAVYEQDKTRLEATGGIRFWDVEVETALGGLNGKASTTITDPFVGFRFATPINDRFSVHSQGSIGIAGDSDNQYDIGAEVRWQWLASTDVAIGYRYMKLEFDKDSALVDASLYGPYLALNFRF